MQLYKCMCGRCESWGSMPPAPCWECPDCKTTPTWNGIGQPTNASPHKWHKNKVDTDEGEKYITVCSWCFQKEKDLKS